MNEALILKIKELNKKETKTVEQIGLKLSEEVGETNQAILSMVGANGSKYKELGTVDVIEETIDIILVALSLLDKIEISEEHTSEMFERKISKWERNTLENNL